jgi:hypothetical protein
MKTKTEIIASFWKHVATDKSLVRQKNKIDMLGMHTSDIRNEFVRYIAYLRDASIVSDELIHNITLHDEHRH